MLKAEALLNVINEIKPGNAIHWPVYNGNDILEAKSIEDYVTVFFKNGDLMPIPNMIFGLNVFSVETCFDDSNNTYKVVIEGIVTEWKQL